MQFLKSSTHPRWFETASRSLGALLSDHLHCERKAAENALSLVRRYPAGGRFAERLTRLAHEETSHLVQVSVLLADRGLPVRADTPNHYARLLFAEIRGQEPERQLDAFLCAALIEARSHERLSLLARGFSRVGDTRLAEFYDALASAEDRHAELFIDLAHDVSPEPAVLDRLTDLGTKEAEIISTLPFGSRIH